MAGSSSSRSSRPDAPPDAGPALSGDSLSGDSLSGDGASDAVRPDDVATAPRPDATDGTPLRMRNAVGSLVLSLLVMAVIGYYTFDAASFQRLLGHVNPWLLGAAAMATAARVVFGGWRLSLISQRRLRLGDGVRAQLAWDFFSNVTPSAIGGGPVATLYVARERGLPLGETSAIMLFAILLDQLWFAVTLPLLLVATFFVEVIPASLGAVGRWTFVVYFVVMLAWAGLFAYATLFRPVLLERLAGRLFSLRPLRRFRQRVVRETRTLARRARRLRQQPLRFYLMGFALTAGAWLGRYALVLLIVWSVYPAFDGVTGGLRTVALHFGGLAMPTPGGSGGLEGLYAVLLGPLMPDALVAPTLLTWRLLGFYVFIALGAYLFAAYVWGRRA
jgi:hypothetical protein